MSADDLDGQDLEAAFDAAFDDDDWAAEVEGVEQVRETSPLRQALVSRDWSIKFTIHTFAGQCCTGHRRWTAWTAVELCCRGCIARPWTA